MGPLCLWEIVGILYTLDSKGILQHGVCRNDLADVKRNCHMSMMF